MQLRTVTIFAVTFIIGVNLVIPPSAQADCYSIYTNAMAGCSTAENERDNAALNIYIARYQNAQNTCNSTVNQDAIAQALAQQTCLNTLYTFTGNPQVFNDLGSCGSAVVAADQAADDAYGQAVTACGTNNQCVCQAVTARNFSKAYAADVGMKCGNDAQNVYNNQCVANSIAVQHQNDGLASAVFINTYGDAYATYEETVALSDHYTAPLCSYPAVTEYANCSLGNSCADGCAKTEDNDYLAAEIAFLNSVGPAYAQYIHDGFICSFTQSHDDYVSDVQHGYAIDIANATYNYNQMVAWNLYLYTTSIDADQHTRDVNLCVCNSTSDSQYNSCVATANATQTANDNNALAAYNQKANVPPTTPTGDNWNTLNQAITTADNVLQAAHATHLLAEQTCVQNTQNTYNAICNSAGTAFNNALNAVDQKYQNCLKGCNGGGA